MDVSSTDGESVTSITVSIDNPEDDDALNVNATAVTTLTVNNEGTSSITIVPQAAGETVSDADYETVLEAVVFDYDPGDGETPVTDTRNISYSASDVDGESATTSSTVTVEE